MAIGKTFFHMVGNGVPTPNTTTITNNMESPKTLEAVKAFHEAFDHPVRDKVGMPSKDRCQLRVDLLQEELNELQTAIDQNDIVEVADALCDLQYVLSGAVLEFGLGEKFKALFDEVQRSNMSKACKDGGEAALTVAHYRNRGYKSEAIQKGDKFIVKRVPDGKILKSVNYSPANLKPILEDK